MTVYVLDSFALLALFRDEPGALRVKQLLREVGASDQLYMSSVNLGEVVYKTIRESGLDKGHDILLDCHALPMTIVPVDEELAIEGAFIKGIHPISYADCIAAALTQRMGATLVTGDRDFEKIRDLDIEWLTK